MPKQIDPIVECARCKEPLSGCVDPIYLSDEFGDRSGPYCFRCAKWLEQTWAGLNEDEQHETR